MARYLLNTNAAIAIILGAPGALDKLRKLPVGDVMLSALSFSELLAGAAAGGPDARLHENLALISDNIDILPFDRAAAESYGHIVKRLDGKRRRTLDRMVAAQAVALGVTLASTSVDDFEDIPGLKIEIWPI